MAKRKAEVGDLVELENGTRLHVVQIDVVKNYPENISYLLCAQTAKQWLNQSTTIPCLQDGGQTFRATEDEFELVVQKPLPKLADGMLTTATCPEEVMWWIESNRHGIASKMAGKYNPPKGSNKKLSQSDGQYLLLSTGAGVRAPMLRIPTHVLQKCYLKPGEKFDNRMYRWDHAAAAAAFRGETEAD